MANLEEKVDKIDQTLTKLFGLVQTLGDSMVTKTEFEEFKSGIYSHIDGFVKLHETLDQELISLRNKYDRLEERLTKVEQKIG